MHLSQGFCHSTELIHHNFFLLNKVSAVSNNVSISVELLVLSALARDMLEANIKKVEKARIILLDDNDCL